MKITIVILIVILIFLWQKIKRTENNFEIQKKKYTVQNENQKHQIEETIKNLDIASDQINIYAQEIENLKKLLDDANRELDFYKNIEEASGDLNVYHQFDKHQQLIEEAAQQIIDSRPVHTNLINQGNDKKSLLDPEQFAACEEVESSSGNFFITGKAGTGKSFLLDVFRKTTSKINVTLAPTGIAALNVNGATLHSTFGYYNLVNLEIDSISNETIRLKSEKRLILRKVSCIIIDEISMVRADTFDKIDRILKVVNHSDKPFGGKQLLLFGDLFQLPPVTKPKEYEYLLDRYGGIYFFYADAYKNGNFLFKELTINHRQKDDVNYFSILNRIRDGSVKDTDIEILNTRVVEDESIYDRFTTLLPTKAEVELLNKHHIDQLNSTGYTYQAKIVFNKHPGITPNLESVFPIANTLYLKKGALVMMVTNDPEHRWVNGTLGIINRLSDESISVSINKRTYDILPYNFIEQEITYVNGKITYEDVLCVHQYPIVPAYAMTIHKSQGQTYQNIVCDIEKCFANGQAYVALSRCESLSGLHLKKQINSVSIQVDKSVLNFYHENIKNTIN